MQCCWHVCYGILSILFLVIRPTWESLKILYTVSTFDHGTHCTYRSIESETAAIILGLQVASCHENSYHPIELVCNKSGPHNGLLNNPKISSQSTLLNSLFWQSNMSILSFFLHVSKTQRQRKRNANSFNVSDIWTLHLLYTVWIRLVI